MSDTQNDQDARTLYVRGITEEIDQEILFELFQNAGPLVKVNIPIDNQTKRKKNFCFVEFQHKETVPYAIDLFRDIKLFGRSLQMQNRTTGAGINRGSQRDQNQGPPSNQHGGHQRTMSAPMHIGQFNPPPFGHPGFNNEMLIAQQQMMMQQRHPMNFNRQFSDSSHDQRSQNQYQQQNHPQDRRYHDDRSRNSQEQPNYGKSSYFVPPLTGADLNMLQPDLEYTVLEEPMFKVGLKLDYGKIFIGEGNSMQNAKNDAAWKYLQSGLFQNSQPERKRKKRDLDSHKNVDQNWNKMMESWVKKRGEKRKIEEKNCQSVPKNKKLESAQFLKKRAESWVKKRKTEATFCEDSNIPSIKKFEISFSEIANLQFFRMKDNFM